MLNVKNFDWIAGLYLITYHLMLFILMPVYLYFHTPNLYMIMISLILMYISGVSVTCGYHRCFSHRAYKIIRAVQIPVLFFATLATQGSAIQWCHDHRKHHKFVDTDQDPYNIKKGFWHAHFLWLLEKAPIVDPKSVPDLAKDKILMFQHKHYGKLLIITNLIIVIGMGHFFSDLLGAFVFAFLLRTFLLHHLTWFINSLAHYWGSRSYCKELSAVDNFIIALLTFGEGYHNYHHTFASDYRNGIKWYHFDPTKWLIWILNKIGLARGLIKMNDVAIGRKLVLEDKQMALKRLRDKFYRNKEELEIQINQLSNRIMDRILEIKKLRHERKKIRGQNLTKLKKNLRDNLRSLKSDWQTWDKLVVGILCA